MQYYSKKAVFFLEKLSTESLLEILTNLTLEKCASRTDCVTSRPQV